MSQGRRRQPMDQLDKDLDGLRVLIVEDEPLISFMLQEMVEDLGCQVAGMFVGVADALEACRGDDFDVALLDLNLAGERVDPVADELVRQGRPFALACGSSIDDGGIGEAAIMPKPYTVAELATVLRRLRAALAG